MAKIIDGEEFWHRMGDVGYFDGKGRLWFCGRKGHRVTTGSDTMFTICCEALFNEHPAVYRSALVGLGPPGRQLPVMIVQLHDAKLKKETVLRELQEIARQNELTRPIGHVLVHPDFPVDIRHNAKIFREKLAAWAAGVLKPQGHNTQEEL